MLAIRDLHGVPDELANRMMMAYGSKVLLRRLRGEPEPCEALALRRPSKPARRRDPRPYVPVLQRPESRLPEIIRVILSETAAEFEVSVDDLTGRSRAKYLCCARAVAYRLMRDRRKPNGELYSMNQIAGFVRRDHTTIIHSLSQFENYCRAYPEVSEHYERLRTRLEVVHV